MDELDVENIVACTEKLVDDFKNAAQELKQTDAKLKQVEAECKRLKESKKQQKSGFKGKFAQIVSMLGKNESEVLARSLYWDEGRFLPQGEILAAFKKSFGKGEIDLSHSFVISCDRCKKSYDHSFNSWTAYDSYYCKKRFRAFYCPSCEIIKQREWELRDQAFEREQEERRQQMENLKDLPYAEYLKTDHWKEVRKGALKRARYRCQLCNNDVPLSVHHRTYEHLGYEYNSDVIALCNSCHEKHHDIIPEYSLSISGQGNTN